MPNMQSSNAKCTAQLVDIRKYSLRVSLSNVHTCYILNTSVGAMTGLLKVAKVTFLLTLIIIHFLAFGLPYIQKYQEDAIGVKESYEKSSALKMPAFTFCPFAKNLIGWKNETNLNPDQNLRLRCDEVPTSSDEVLSCIQNKTYSLSDTIQNARHGMFSKNDLSTFEYWEWDMTVHIAGRCYTFNYNKSFPGLDVLEDGLFFDLDPDLIYMVFLHMPDFFSLTYNGMTMPTTMMFLKQPKGEELSYTNILLEVRSQVSVGAKRIYNLKVDSQKRMFYLHDFYYLHYLY